MGPAIGDVLPLAVGIAVSPVPIIAAILMLLSPKARATSVGFLIGWVVGILLAATVFTLLSSLLPSQSSDAANPVQGVVHLVLGLLLLLLAVKQWRSRPKGDEEATLPKWMQAIDTFTFGKALGLAFLLAAVNPKNLLLAASAGVAIGGAALSTTETSITIGIFTLLAASTIAIPVIAYLIASQKLRAPLESLREWLQKENTTIMAILLLVLGVSLIGKAIGNF